MLTTVESSTVAGRPADFETIFRTHQERVLRAAYRVTGNLPDAEDVLQTVFLRLLRQGHELETVGDIGNYLYRAGINAGLDVVRSRKSATNVPIEDHGLHVSSEPAWDPERSQSSAEIRDWLRRAVAQMHPTAAEMFVLRYFEGYENQEIAGIMQTSEGTVAVTLHRTRARLQQEIRAAFGGRQ
jgi:RNA polymerase sigma-70 factor (ECF subfamily)